MRLLGSSRCLAARAGRGCWRRPISFSFAQPEPVATSRATTLQWRAASAAPAESKQGLEVKSEEQREEKEEKVPAASLSQLWGVLRPERGRLQLALGALCASSTVNLSYPYLMGRLVDLFGEGGEGLNFVMEHTITCGGIVLAGGLATFCRLYLIETAIERIGFRLRREFFWSLLQRPIAFFDSHKTGELINRLGNDITVTSRVIVDVSAGFRSAITACVGTCMVFQLAPAQMMTALLAPVAALFLVGVGYGRLVRRIAAERQQRLADAVQLAEERLSGIRTVRTFNAEVQELNGFERMQEAVYEAGRRNALASAGLSCILVSGGGLFLLHIIYNCGMMVTSGVLSIGTTVTLSMYCFMAGSSYTGLMTSYGDIQKALGSCQKVLEILGHGNDDQIPVKAALTEAVTSAQAPLAVRFEGVSFSYPSRSEVPVLQSLDLDIPAGARVALLGRSGSGKSTVAQLLAGLYAPAAGRVLVDGKDMFAEPGASAWVRSQLGVISQEPTLFALSIKDNVTYGLPEDAEQQKTVVMEATAAAHVDEFVGNLPQGMDTLAGELGRASCSERL
eukprot:TRINITY_DN80660_c0_g1_i1.p1 TRINITY_DN80660_c0_g1~~TRINITY_DN80660_c0_g1_i1.p1  ORF type:complete len:575 (+),score=112.07 TRINITY_DN80660_c0_g1_i1:36-1727(+)